MDFIKIGVRLGAVAGILAVAVGIYALFSQVQVPASDVSGIVQAIGMGKAMLNHWAPEFFFLMQATIALFFIKWSIFFLRYAVMGMRWLLIAWR